MNLNQALDIGKLYHMKDRKNTTWKGYRVYLGIERWIAKDSNIGMN